MMVYFVVMTMCTGMEGCVDERQATAYSSREECLQTISAFPRQKGIKYKCRKGPQAELIEARRLEGQRVFLSSEANH
jgi:hypothetical protein